MVDNPVTVTASPARESNDSQSRGLGVTGDVDGNYPTTEEPRKKDKEIIKKNLKVIQEEPEGDVQEEVTTRSINTTHTVQQVHMSNDPSRLPSVLFRPRNFLQKI